MESVTAEVMPRSGGHGRGHRAAPRHTGPYSTRSRMRSARIATPPPTLVPATNDAPAKNKTGASTSGRQVANRGLEEFIDLVCSNVREEHVVAHNPTSSVTTVAESLTLTNTTVHSRPLPSSSIVSSLPGLPWAPLPAIAGTSIPLTAGECRHTRVRTRSCVVGQGAHVY